MSDELQIASLSEIRDAYTYARGADLPNGPTIRQVDKELDLFIESIKASARRELLEQVIVAIHSAGWFSLTVESLRPTDPLAETPIDTDEIFGDER